MSQVASLGFFTFSFEFELYFMRNGINCSPRCHWVWLYICISIGIGCLPNLSSIFLSWRHNDRRRTCVALFVQVADSDVLTGLRSPLLEMIQLVLRQFDCTCKARNDPVPNLLLLKQDPCCDHLPFSFWSSKALGGWGSLSSDVHPSTTSLQLSIIVEHADVARTPITP